MLLNCLKHTGTAFALPVPINIDELNITNVKHYLVRELNGIIYIWYGEAEEAAEKLPFFMIKLMEAILTEKRIQTSILFSRTYG